MNKLKELFLNALGPTIAFLVIFLFFTPFGWLFISMCYNSIPSVANKHEQEWREQHDIGKWGSPPMCHLKDSDSVMETGDNSRQLKGNEKILATDKWENWKIHAFNEDIKSEWIGKTVNKIDPKHEITFVRITLPNE